MFNYLYFISRSRPSYAILIVSIRHIINSLISLSTVRLFGYPIFIIIGLSFLCYSVESLANNLLFLNDLTLSSLFLPTRPSFSNNNNNININNNDIDTDLSIKLTDRDVASLKANLDTLQQASQNQDLNNTATEPMFVDLNLSPYEEAFPVWAKENEKLFNKDSIIDEGLYKESFEDVSESVVIGPTVKAIKEDPRFGEVFRNLTENDIKTATNETQSMRDIIDFKEGVLQIDFNNA